MNILCSQLGGLAALFIIEVLIIGGFYFWYYQTHQQGMHFTDNQIVGLLMNLLVFGFINILLFILIILGKIGHFALLCP